MKINVLSIFPEMFTPVVSGSILGRAADRGAIDIRLLDVRDYTKDKHKKVDDTPFGGGAGMLMSVEPFYHALMDIGAENKKVIYMSPRGTVLNESKILELSKLPELTILCGHYEGIDQRVLDQWHVEEISIGDYVLTGGELPAMVLIDAVARMIPTVLGSEDSHKEESIYSGLLEYPQYTKPREFMDRQVPEVLLSGHHENIHLWQLEQSLILTRKRRPDLFDRFVAQNSATLTKKEKKILDRVIQM